MLKITIQVKENKNADTCNVELITPKDISKATTNEKTTGAMVVNEITRTLQSMQNKK
jgi:hypothetical protein